MAEDKLYLSANDYLAICYRLADNVYRSGWLPDLILAVWRGGAPVGMTVHEYLRYCTHHVQHDIVKCASYTGIDTRTSTVELECPPRVLEFCRSGIKVLVTDDIFDSGMTAQAIIDKLAPTQADVRIATPFWHIGHNQTKIQPDYYIHQTDRWVVFPHEMEGLTPDELKRKNDYLYGLLYPHPPASDS